MVAHCWCHTECVSLLVSYRVWLTVGAISVVSRVFLGVSFLKLITGADSVLGKPGSRLSKNYRDKKRSPQIFKSVAMNLWCGETHLAINRIYIPFTF